MVPSILETAWISWSTKNLKKKKDSRCAFGFRIRRWRELGANCLFRPGITWLELSQLFKEPSLCETTLRIPWVVENMKAKKQTQTQAVSERAEPGHGNSLDFHWLWNDILVESPQCAFHGIILTMQNTFVSFTRNAWYVIWSVCHSLSCLPSLTPSFPFPDFPCLPCLDSRHEGTHTVSVFLMISKFPCKQQTVHEWIKCLHIYQFTEAHPTPGLLWIVCASLCLWSLA